MAHWISSKLKAAETLLQQIDQQAAESLRKNEKLQSDDQLGAEKSTSVPETKPLIKNQLKKKAPENLPIQISVPSDKHNVSVIDRSNSSGNRGNESLGPQNLNSSDGVFNDGDWTELLSVPDRKGLSGGGSNNRVSGILSLKKDATKVGNRGAGWNPSQIDEKSESVRNNGSFKNSKKSQVGLVNYSGTNSGGKASNVGDVAPKMSSIQLTGSAGELDNRDNSLPHVIDNAKMETKGDSDEVKDVVTGEKQHSLDDSYHPSHKTPNSHQREFDMKVSMNDNEMFKRGMRRSDESIEDSQISSSTEKVSSLPSDGGSSSETDTGSSSDSENEKEREERRKRRQQILVEKAAAKAVEAIKERENLVARLEGEKQSLEKILEERAKQQVQEASDLQTTMMETMEAAELEKQKHNNTRMEVFARLAKLESANADLARSLANVQKNLDVEVDRVAELRQQIYMKEAAQEELRRKLSSTHQSGEKFQASKGAELELEMLETEYSFLKEKVERMQDKAKALESSIETTRREIENPTEVELELKQRLGLLTDHLIQKQAKVETLTSEKAMLLLRIEAVSRMLDENKGMVDSADVTGTSSRNDLESGIWQLSYPNLRPSLNEKMQSGKRHLGSLVLQFDSLFCAGALFLRRNSTARIWALVYLICLHLWVFYILTSHAPASDDGRTGAVISLENINNTGGV